MLCQCLEHRGQQQTHRAADAGAKQRWSNGIGRARNFRCRQKPICPRISRLVFCAVVLNVGKCQSATRCFVTVIVTDLYSEACPALQYFIRRHAVSGGVLQGNRLSLLCFMTSLLAGRERGSVQLINASNPLPASINGAISINGTSVHKRRNVDSTKRQPFVDTGFNRRSSVTWQSVDRN